ncbi:MAG: hypothetical protein ACAH95_14155 [Fimbriimonas sp.]
MELLRELVGRKVTVFSLQGGSERQDVGVLEAIDTTWFRLRKAETEVMYFSVYQVRLIKPFDAH